jgi:hypothetical protein
MTVTGRAPRQTSRRRPWIHEERDVARAKNTDRAEARRRYRAATAAEVESDAMSVPAAAVPRDARASGVPKGPAEPVKRPGVVESFRLSARPADVRGDIRALPRILRTEPRVWLAPGLVVLGGVILVVPQFGESSIGRLITGLLIFPQPLIPYFLGGMLVSRGAWLIGLLTGLLAGIISTIYILTVSTTGASGITTAQRSDALLYVIIVSPLFGLATGAFAGFYRRFLRIASPAQQQRKTASKGQRPAAKPGK